jgi:hypothetical protein
MGALCFLPLSPHRYRPRVVVPVHTAARPNCGSQHESWFVLINHAIYTALILPTIVFALEQSRERQTYDNSVKRQKGRSVCD